MIEMCGTSCPKSHAVPLGRGATGVGRSCISLQLASRAMWQVTKLLRAGDYFFCQFSNLSNEQENKSS